jgi:hypothetical protein
MAISARFVTGRKSCTASKLRDCLSTVDECDGDECSNERECSCSRCTIDERTVDV